MNLGQLRTAVYDQIGLDEQDGLVTPVIVDSRLNRALVSYQGEASWPWLEASETITTVAGTDTYTPAADWNRTRGMRDVGQGNVIEFRSIMQLDDRWVPGVVGRPVEFAVEADHIVVRPVPDNAYAMTHRYERNETTLVNDSDTPTLPAQYHEALIEYAAYLCFRRVRETERMQEALNAYNGWIKKMRSRAMKRVDLTQTPRERPGGWL